MRWGPCLSPERYYELKTFQNGKSKTILLVGMPKNRKSIRKIPLPGFLLKLSNELKMYAENENCYILSDSEVPIDPRTYQKTFQKDPEKCPGKRPQISCDQAYFCNAGVGIGCRYQNAKRDIGSRERVYHPQYLCTLSYGTEKK